MQLPRMPVIPPVAVIFDCDMGNRIEDVLALALLYGSDNKNESRLFSVSVSKSNLKAGALCDAILRFYARAAAGQFSSFFRALPIGVADDGKMPEDTPLLTEMLNKVDAQGQPLYPNEIRKWNDTAECGALIRNAFTAQHDQNAIVVLAGPGTNMARVLDVPGTKDLIARKVRYLVMTAGSYPTGKADPNVSSDPAATKRLLAEWPTPIVACGQEVGEAIPYPGSSIETDFTWTPTHPVVHAYRAYKPMPYDAPATDMAAALYALRPKEGYFKLSEPGVISVRDDGTTEFAPKPDGKHRYLIADPAQRDRIMKTYREMVSAKPAPRRPRFPIPQQQQQQEKKPEAPKPSETKAPSSGR